MSTRITPPPRGSPGGMLFGNCQSISGAVGTDPTYPSQNFNKKRLNNIWWVI
jgi:hypothetical protein